VPITKQIIRNECQKQPRIAVPQQYRPYHKNYVSWAQSEHGERHETYERSNQWLKL